MTEKGCLIQKYSVLNVETRISPQNKELTDIGAKQAHLPPEQSQQDAGRNQVDQEIGMVRIGIRHRVGYQLPTPLTAAFAAAAV